MSQPTISFTVFGKAEPAGSKRAFVIKGTNRARITDANPKSRSWKDQVAQIAALEMDGRDMLFGGLSLELQFYRPRPSSHFTPKGKLRASAPQYPITRPDATKLLRGVEDAMTGIVWRDDAQIVLQLASKLFGDPARVEIIVLPLEVKALDERPIFSVLKQEIILPETTTLRGSSRKRRT